MSKLASKIAAAPPPEVTANRRGPANSCFPLYGHGDLEDWEQVEALRISPAGGQLREWRHVQAHVDHVAGVTKPITLEKFKYHWRRRCFCWPVDLRR